MGIQITIIDGPEAEEAFECLCTQAGEPEAGCRWCEGTGTTYDVFPEFMLDLCNANAMALFRVLGVPVDPCDPYGEFSAAQVGDLRRSILGALNAPKRRKTGIRDGEAIMAKPHGVELADGSIRLVRDQPRYLAMGLDDDGVIDRLKRFDALLAKAQELGQGVRYS